VFIEKSEIRSGPEDTIFVHFDESDERCKHIKTILKLEVNDAIKMGVVDVGSTDRAIVIDPLEASGITISMGKDKDLLPNSRPSVDMILAVPRPLRLERILPVVSCMGVGRLVLIGAAKVQQDYFGKEYQTSVDAIHLFEEAKYELSPQDLIYLEGLRSCVSY
jgi:16S rRNA U1498 N3-methylase RsmE